MAERKNEARWIANRNRWQINVQKDGARKTFCSSIPGKKGKIEAEKKADKWLEDGDANDTIRLNKLWELFLADTKDSTGSANYVKHEQIGRTWLLPNLKHKRVSKITCQDWQVCINAAYKAGRAKKTCQNIRGSVAALYRYAKKRRISMMPPEGLSIPKDAPTKPRTILQAEDLSKLFQEDTIMVRGKNTQAWYINLWRLVVLTGLRRGEACGLLWTDINDSMLTISRSINSLNEITQGKTQNAKRIFMLSGMAQQVLISQKKMVLQNGIISEWVFCNELGQRPDPNEVYKQWARYRIQHGITSSIHEIRHTHISWLKSRAPEPLLKREVGHGVNMDTYGIYGHAVDGEMQIIADTVDSVFMRFLDGGK